MQFNKEINFSLVMPLYNSKDTLEKAIRSILDQSYRNYELILVDDCSTDGSYDIGKKFAGENEKITLYRMGKNKGAPYCMNFGTKMAKYEWIGIVDSDAIETKNRLSITNSGIDKNIEVIGGRYVHVFPENSGYFNKVFYYIEGNQFPDTDQIYNKENYNEPCIMGGNFFFTKNVFDKNKGFDEATRAGYDRLFLCDAIENGFTVKFLTNSMVCHPLYNYRNISDIFRRSFIFNKWRVSILKKSNLISKKYRIINYSLISLIVYIAAGVVLIGLKNLIFLSLIIFLISFVILIFYIHLKKKVPYKYTFGYILIEIIKKILGVYVYLFKIKPAQPDWKNR
ncbi:MAG: glycosyltransferase [Actinobacteria bacterium]|nr:glycosyltransferase [Actinomycetota bacterium]